MKRQSSESLKLEIIDLVMVTANKDRLKETRDNLAIPAEDFSRLMPKEEEDVRLGEEDIAAGRIHSHQDVISEMRTVIYDIADSKKGKKDAKSLKVFN